jgi:hypothetical protein
VAGLYEHGNEPLGSIRNQDFFDKLSDNQLLKYPAPWSILKATMMMMMAALTKMVDINNMKISTYVALGDNKNAKFEWLKHVRRMPTEGIPRQARF